MDLQPLKKAFELYSELEKENERLKAEVRKWKRDSTITSAMFRLVVQGKECTSTKVLEEAERVENLEKENAKLKCLALFYKSEMNKFKSSFYGLASKFKRQVFYIKKFECDYKAYRKAKKALREGK